MKLDADIAIELVSHEGLDRQAYKGLVVNNMSLPSKELDYVER